MIRIAVDARELSGRPTGTGRYLRELLARWQLMPEAGGAHLVLITADPTAPQRVPERRGPGATLAWRHVAGRGGTTWEQRELARAVQAADVQALFSPAYTTPLRVRVPIVLAMHDVSFAAHPEWFPSRLGWRMRVLARWSARKAHTVLTLTRFSAAEIQTHLGTAASKLRVIPLAVDYLDTVLAARSATPPPPVVLFVGSIFERRHLPLLFEGVALARRAVPDLRLEVIGDNRTFPRQDLCALAADLGIGDAVRLRDYVTDEDLHAAYASAGVFAFLSAYEGFGLTPLEAMQQGLPTVVLDTPVAREVYGAGAQYVPAGQPEAVAASLLRLVTEPEIRAAQIAAGDAAVARYRWDDAARLTWDALVNAARHGVQ
ncbi:MAG: glycosyltransferase family 4 protein [Luteitalea sp.]